MKCFTANPLSKVKSAATRIVNCLTKAINDKSRAKVDPEKITDKFLPRIVVVIPDWDVIKYIDHDDYGVDEVFGGMIKWMIETMIKTVQDKKDQMMKIKPGSVTPGEPKFIWVKVIQRLGSTYDKAMSVRNHFNKLLEMLLAEKKHHYIIDMDPQLQDSKYFNPSNELNADGRVKFWNEINESVDLFEVDKLKLQPAANPDTADNREQTTQQKRFRLPPPRPKIEQGTHEYKQHHRNNKNGSNNHHHDHHDRRNKDDRQWRPRSYHK